MGRKSSAGKVRIIGGQWRGRKLPVVDVSGLRPTPDRARETLFNWLAPVIEGARCLDLFAGTGALGFEAASRGAQHVDFVEQHVAACDALRSSADMLGTAKMRVHQADALAWLTAQSATSWDIIFADPPYAMALERATLDVVVDSNCLAPGGHLYLESPGERAPPELPGGWSVYREKRVGDVVLRLLRS